MARELSGGNQQKVVLGRWLLHECKVLLLDEPTRGVDVETKAELYRLIAALAASGLGVLVVSSENEELCGMCTRILVMREGELVAELDGATATELEILPPRDARDAADGDCRRAGAGRSRRARRSDDGDRGNDPSTRPTGCTSASSASRPARRSRSTRCSA